MAITLDAAHYMYKNDVRFHRLVDTLDSNAAHLGFNAEHVKAAAELVADKITWRAKVGYNRDR